MTTPRASGICDSPRELLQNGKRLWLAPAPTFLPTGSCLPEARSMIKPGHPQQAAERHRYLHLEAARGSSARRRRSRAVAHRAVAYVARPDRLGRAVAAARHPLALATGALATGAEAVRVGGKLGPTAVPLVLGDVPGAARLARRRLRRRPAPVSAQARLGPRARADPEEGRAARRVNVHLHRRVFAQGRSALPGWRSAQHRSRRSSDVTDPAARGCIERRPRASPPR
jgi:hypothetical protein